AVVLTQAGAELVNSGQELPAFTLIPNDGTTDGETVNVDPSVDTVNDAPEIINLVSNDFIEDDGSAVEGAEVATFETFDEDGDDVTVTLSDTVNYALVDGAVVLTQAGAELVNSGQELPAFTLIPNDGMTDGDTVSVDPSVTTVNDAPEIINLVSNDFTEDDGSAVEGAEVATFDTFDEDGDNVVVTLSDTVNYALVDGAVVLTQAGAELVNSGQDLPGFTLVPSDGSTDGEAVSVDPSVTTVDDLTNVETDTASTNEDTPIVIDVLANDTDEEGIVSPVASVNDGENGTVTINDDGTVTYSPNTNFNGSDSFTYTNEDGTTETVNINVNPINDQTEITVGSDDSDTSDLTEDLEVATDGKLTDSGTLTFTDVDIEDSSNFVPSVEFTPANEGDIALGEMTINSDGEWSYEVDNSVVQNLAEGEILTEVYTISLNGVKQNITVTINGVDDLSVVSGDATGAVTEDNAATLSTSGTLSLSDVDSSDTTTFTAETINGTYGDITIDADGNWTYAADNTQAAIQSLDDGESITDTITVMTSDGVEQEIVITINGVDDLSIVAGDATGEVTEDDASTLSTTGTLSLSDIDSSDTTTFTAETVSGTYGAITIDADGNWTYAADNTQAAIQSLDDGESITDTITVMTSDGVEQEIVITINGMDDLSIVAGDTTSAVTEDDAATLSTTGTLSLSDIDSSDTTTFTAETINGTYGEVTIDADGNWTYAADNTQAAIQSLDDGESITDTITVMTSDGVEQEIVITINGVDDLSIVAG
ncbi:VCBS domain-containing protein, partial [Psychromonas arctica]|uniref:VCBS domain-containing protein n=1 Tax=Psychromonas arctica TaxID=168275 RepID=UPI002FD5D1E6